MSMGASAAAAAAIEAYKQRGGAGREGDGETGREGAKEMGAGKKKEGKN